MRIWSIHPKYLDSKGLVALWRETLLAKKVLEGKTKGYKNHPQLERFKKSKSPVDCINHYLSIIFRESAARGYNFNKDKVDWHFKRITLKVTTGQINYERTHLLNKLKFRNNIQYRLLVKEKYFQPHPLFKTIEGKIEVWEKINNRI
jgi:hypothetical protein